jgi:hypothetical protein
VDHTAHPKQPLVHTANSVAVGKTMSEPLLMLQLRKEEDERERRTEK